MPRLESYDIRSGEWQTVALNPSLQEQCDPPYGGTGVLTATGADWFELDVSCYHCSTTPAFQNLRTGALGAIPRLGRHELIDLNSPALKGPLCAPVSVPTPGEAVPDGRSVLLNTPRGLFAQRCGSTHRRLLARRIGEYAATPDILLLYLAALTDTIAGLDLNTLEHFEIRLPPQLTGANQLLLCGRYLFISGEAVWEAVLPAKLWLLSGWSQSEAVRSARDP